MLLSAHLTACYTTNLKELASYSRKLIGFSLTSQARPASALLQLCCSFAATVTKFLTHVLIGSQSVSLPAHACQDLPPASHSGCGAGGLAGLQAGPWFASALLLSASRPGLSRAPAVALLEIAEAARQDVRVWVGGQNKAHGCESSCYYSALFFSGQR